MPSTNMKSLPTPKLLIVDDIRANLVATRALLRDFELDIYTAESAKDGLALAAEHDFALALLDVAMPEMDGVEMATELRKDERTRAVPIIFLTAHRMGDEHIFEAYGAGALDYMLKPIDENILRSKVSVLLELHERTRLLEQSQQQLQQQNQELEKFARTASHDLKTPLSQLSAFTSLLELEMRGRVSTEVADIIDRMRRSVMNQARLIDDLLRYSRAGYQDIDFEQVDISEIVGQLRADFMSLYEQDHATIEFNELGVVDGSRTMLWQLFQNLVGNALKYRQSTVAPIIVVKRESGLNDPLCVVTVTDNGIGIDNASTNEVFTPFLRLNKNSAEGSGLGLATVKRIIERHGGSIEVGAAPAQGTIFTVELPRTQR